jgi:hypothetical protein
MESRTADSSRNGDSDLIIGERWGDDGALRRLEVEVEEEDEDGDGDREGELGIL